MQRSHFLVHSSSSIWEEDFWEQTDYFKEQLAAEQFIFGLPTDCSVLLTRVSYENEEATRTDIFEGKAINLITGNPK